LDGFYYYTFGTMVFFSILYSLYIIIDNQEVILFKLSEQGNLKILSQNNESRKLKEDEWRCSGCGKINPNYINFCGCGYSKPKQHE